MLLVSAETHDVLHTGPVVPGAIKKDDLPPGREMLYVTLEVPLGTFTIRGRGESCHLDHPWVEVLADAADGAALAGAVAAFEDHRHPGAADPHPFLQLDQLHLQAPHLLLVDLGGQRR